MINEKELARLEMTWRPIFENMGIKGNFKNLALFCNNAVVHENAKQLAVFNDDLTGGSKEPRIPESILPFTLSILGKMETLDKITFMQSGGSEMPTFEFKMEVPEDMFKEYSEDAIIVEAEVQLAKKIAIELDKRINKFYNEGQINLFRTNCLVEKLEWLTIEGRGGLLKAYIRYYFG